MYAEEEDILYYDFNPEPDTEYFLYVGELKTDCLNPFLRDALSRIFDKKFDFISILPDVMACYPHRNILVINPLSRELIKKNGCKVSCRLTNRYFNRRVSESRTVYTLIQELLKRQNRLFVHVFESVPEMTLNRNPGVILLGPDGEIAHLWNNKLHQLQVLQNTSVPVIDFRVCAGYTELLQVTDSLWDEWDRGIFISEPYSAAGMNSFIAFCAGDLEGRELFADSMYFASKYIPHISDPTVLGVVANGDDVFIAAVADQDIEGGNTFKGSVFPSALPPAIQKELKEVACNKMEHGVIVMEHLGQGLQAEPGSFVGRIAAVSRRRDFLEEDIQAGKELLRKSIKIRDDNES